MSQRGATDTQSMARRWSPPAEDGLGRDAVWLSQGREAFVDFAAASRSEWLVTNGIGGFASGTVSGATTRRYHALLLASLRPPLERVVTVAKLDVIARYGPRSVPLTSNEYSDGTVDPHGYRHLECFTLEGMVPVWRWVIGDAVLEQRIWMAHGENTTYVSYHLARAELPLELEVHPLCTYRDYHWQLRGQREITLRSLDAELGIPGFEVTAAPGAHPYRVLLEGGEYRLAPDWHWNLKHRAESERGLDDAEDLLRPAVIRMQLRPNESASIILSTTNGIPLSATPALQRERTRQRELLARADAGHSQLSTAPQWIRQLVLAADQFIVERRTTAAAALAATASGRSVIAGYPWFSDWGRDTMIALPGLALVTGRPEIAASVLRTFAGFVSQGMLPNRFPDAGEIPEYNTVDATLWYFIAVHAYLRHTRDAMLRAELYPVLRDIIGWHIRGTRFGIRVDESDGLLTAGAAGTQLTWMDAKVGDWVVTPRAGKCVEINALWFNALMIMCELAAAEQDAGAAVEFATRAARVADSFNERFWFEAGGYLYDVIDPRGNADASLRPNQLFALALPHMLLEHRRASAVVEVCARTLWTPLGLRSLAADQPGYIGQCCGTPLQRDGAYHQGTVWSWLLGPFAIAHFRVHGNAALARSYLTGMAGHLRQGCIGQISEVFDGEPPFTPRGCYAQAWGVAETLRAWSELHDA
jgi:predicted glycogen debranching enzyme